MNATVPGAANSPTAGRLVRMARFLGSSEGGLKTRLMRYVVNDWTYYGDQLKMHEYLASGKPTIAAGLNSIRRFADVIAIPETPDGWIAAIEQGLHEDTETAQARRIDTARCNSYETRIAQATAVLRQALDKKR